MGVISQSSRRIGQMSLPAQRPRVRLKSSVGKKLVAEDHDQHHGENGLGDLGGGGPGEVRRAIEEDRAEFQRDEAQGKLLQNRRADGSVLAGESELRLDQLLPGVEILLDLAGEDFAELGVDAADVGGQRLDGGEKENEEEEGKGHRF